MSRNHAEDGLETRLLGRLVAVEKIVLASSTPQPVGSDIIDLTLFPDPPIDVNPLTVTSNQSTFVIIALAGTGDHKTLVTPLVSINVDVDSANHLYPFGGSLTDNQRKLRYSSWEDLTLSVTPSVLGFVNPRYFVLRLENYDTVSHTYYIHAQFHMPKNAAIVVNGYLIEYS